jgi:hypothetical protein
MNKVFGWVILIFGIMGICLDAVWCIQLTTDWPVIPPEQPDTTYLYIITFAIFFIISMLLTYLAVYQIKKKQ